MADESGAIFDDADSVWDYLIESPGTCFRERDGHQGLLYTSQKTTFVAP